MSVHKRYGCKMLSTPLRSLSPSSCVIRFMSTSSSSPSVDTSDLRPFSAIPGPPPTHKWLGFLGNMSHFSNGPGPNLFTNMASNVPRLIKEYADEKEGLVRLEMPNMFRMLILSNAEDVQVYQSIYIFRFTLKIIKNDGCSALHF